MALKKIERFCKQPNFVLHNWRDGELIVKPRLADWVDFIAFILKEEGLIDDFLELYPETKIAIKNCAKRARKDYKLLFHLIEYYNEGPAKYE